MKNNITALKAHISLSVKDTKKSVEFYRKLFGIEPLKIRDGYAKFDISNPPLNLALNQFSSTGRGNLSHLGIQVAQPPMFWKSKSVGKNPGFQPTTKCRPIAVTRFKTRPGFPILTAINGKFLLYWKMIYRKRIRVV